MDLIYSSDFVSAMLGVFVGAIITWRMTHWFDRRQNAVELYSQFCGTEMERVRHSAGTFLRSNKAADHPISFERLHCGDFSTELADVTRLINFWEKVENLQKFNYIDKTFTKVLLRHYFNSHMNSFLETLCNVSERTDRSHYLQWTKVIRDLQSRWPDDPDH